jgi:hypothetical protein
MRPHPLMAITRVGARNWTENSKKLAWDESRLQKYHTLIFIVASDSDFPLHTAQYHIFNVTEIITERAGHVF